MASAEGTDESQAEEGRAREDLAALDVELGRAHAVHAQQDGHALLLRIGVLLVLPGRFGGSGADYQVVETEDDEDQPELLLLVSPRLGAVDAAAVREAFLTGLAETGASDKHRTAFWRRSGMVKVRREWPVVTPYGKTLPFHVAPRASGTRT